MNKRKTPKSNLENKRVIFLEIGFIIALAAVLFAFEYKTFDKMIDLKEYYNNYEEVDELAPLVMKKQELPPERPKPQTVINVVDDDIEIDDEIEIDDFTDDQDTPVGDWVPVELIDDIDEEIIPFYAVSVKPEFPGGETAMMRFLADHFSIPRIDKQMGNQGKIYVGFVIDKDGNVTDVAIKRGLSPTADAEALRVVSMMPQWSPAQQGIKKVAVSYVIPIHVKLM